MEYKYMHTNMFRVKPTEEFGKILVYFYITIDDNHVG